MSARARRGFTLVELLVVIAIIGILVALLLPAVQQAREAARKIQCQNNLKQLSLAALGYENARKGFPPRRFRAEGHGYTGWGTFLLPYMEQQSIYDQYQFEYDFYDPVNKAVVETKLDTFICPSTPRSTPIVVARQATTWSSNSDKSTTFEVKGWIDYLTPNGMNVPESGWGLQIGDGSNQSQALADTWGEKPDYTPRKLSDITDGLSNTLLFNDTAGWADSYQGRTKIGPMDVYNRGSWAAWQSWVYLTYSRDGTMSSAANPAAGDVVSCAVNCNNRNQVYSFHPGGAHVSYCDGSVHFVSEQLHPLNFARMVIIDDGQVFENE